MKFKNTKISKRTTALLAAAILLLSAGGYSGTKANLTVFSTDYDATIELNEIAVDLLENGTAVGAKDEPGVLLGALDGTVEPTYTYTEKISVKNTGTAPEFVRVVVRKYWVDPEGDMVKDTELKPELIELHQANSDWVENTAEQTDETSVFYLTTALEPGDTSDLFDTFRLSERLVEINEDGLVITSEKQGDKTIYTYNYPYDGYQCYIEAEAQSIQTHNGTDAVRSIWGVENVTASGTSLSVG